MRVLQLNTERTWRGGERQTLWTASSLQNAGDWCGIACRAGYPLARHGREAGLPILVLNPLLPWDPLAAWRLKQLASDHQIDVIHAQTSHAVTLTALARTFGMNRPVVVTRRVDFPIRHSGKYNASQRVIAISEAIKNVLLTSGVKLELIEVIPSGIDVEAASPERQADLRERLLRGGSLLFGSVGHLAHHKGFDVLLQAWPSVAEAVPGARLVIAGEGEERSRLEAIIANHHLDESVSLAGFVESPREYMSCFDVYLQPSRTEGLGSSAIEALHMGLPVVATAAGGLPEVLDGGRFGRLVPPEDADELATAMIATARELPDHDGLAGTEWVERQFSRDSMVRATRQVYTDAIQRYY